VQNCIGCEKGDTGCSSETCVTGDGGGTEEVSIKVEEAVDVKGEIPEAITFPQIKTGHEVRLWGVCELLAAHAFRPFIAPKGN
jgi:hypothetical protein